MDLQSEEEGICFPLHEAYVNEEYYLLLNTHAPRENRCASKYARVCWGPNQQCSQSAFLILTSVVGYSTVAVIGKLDYFPPSNDVTRSSYTRSISFADHEEENSIDDISIREKYSKLLL